jgi:phosphatidylglycerophosphatase A
VAPGTAGSLVALVAGAALLALSPWLLLVATLGAVAAGMWSIRAAGATGDPGWVVIDEVAGQWLAILIVWRPDLVELIAAFALFRLLDIAKPGPVAWAERLPGAAGVMADDLVAGACTGLLLRAVAVLVAVVFPG